MTLTWLLDNIVSSQVYEQGGRYLVGRYLFSIFEKWAFY